MKKLLTLSLILCSFYLFAQDTVVTKQTVITNGDTDVQYTITVPTSTRVTVKELQAIKAGLIQEKAIYQGYIESCNERIARINERIIRLRTQAK